MVCSTGFLSAEQKTLQACQQTRQKSTRTKCHWSSMQKGGNIQYISHHERRSYWCWEWCCGMFWLNDQKLSKFIMLPTRSRHSVSLTPCTNPSATPVLCQTCPWGVNWLQWIHAWSSLVWHRTRGWPHHHLMGSPIPQLARSLQIQSTFVESNQPQSNHQFDTGHWCLLQGHGPHQHQHAQWSTHHSRDDRNHSNQPQPVEWATWKQQQSSKSWQVHVGSLQVAGTQWSTQLTHWQQHYSSTSTHNITPRTNTKATAQTTATYTLSLLGCADYHERWLEEGTDSAKKWKPKIHAGINQVCPQQMQSQSYILAMLHTRCYVPTPSISHPPEKIHNEQKQITTAFLAKIGYPQTFPHAVAYAPKPHSGIGLCHLDDEQGTQKILQILKHLWAKTTIDTVYQVLINQYQLNSGFPEPILKTTTAIAWSQAYWINTLHAYLAQIKGKIKLEQPWLPKACRDNDQLLMWLLTQATSESGIPQVTYIYNLSTGSIFFKYYLKIFQENLKDNSRIC